MTQQSQPLPAAEQDTAASGRQLTKWLKGQKKRSNGLLGRSIALGAMNGLIMIGQTALLAWILNGVIFEHVSLSELTTPCLALLGIILVRGALGYWSEVLGRQASVRIKADIRRELLDKLFSLGPAHLYRNGRAATASLIHQGVESLEDYFAGYLPAIAYCSVIPLAILVIVFPFDWLAGLIFLLTAPFIPFFMILIGKRAEAMNQKHWARLLRMSSHFLDTIQGLTQLKLFNSAKRELEAVKVISEEYRVQTMKILRIAFLSSFFLEFLASVSVALVAVVLGFSLYYGKADYFMALWVLLLAPEFYLPFRNLGTQYHAKMAGASAAEDMVKLLQSSYKSGENTNLTVDPDSRLTVNLSALSFSWPGRKQAINDLSLSFSGPGLFALVGESGAGKSTLMELLLGFLTPASGAVRIQGQSLTAENRDDWLNHCGWIAQQPHLFYGSLASNLSLSDKWDEALAWQALDKAGLKTFVEGLPQGLESLVGESGAGLSGGQKQRLALARVFYHQPAVLFLDEPSSHLDKDTERMVSEAITEYARTHLVIVIAHRLKTVQQAKQIVVLHEGAVAEQGNHDELMAARGRYWQTLTLSGAKDA